MRQIPIYRKKEVVAYAQVSDEDYEYLNQFRWGVKRYKNLEYVRRGSRKNGEEKRYQMHRVVLERVLNRTLLSSEQVDHKDGSGLNNQRGNVRLATRSQNQMNKGKRTTPSQSQFKGVTWHKRSRKWYAQIRLDQKQIYIGMFNSEEDAAQAYKDKAKELFGEFYTDR